MNIHEYTSELASRLAVRRFFIYAFAASIGVNLILAGGIVTMEDKSRVVVLPAEPTKSFWLDDKTVSPEYLEQMGSYLVQLALNNSPETFEHNMTQLLKYADPEKRGDIELMLLKQGRQMKSSGSSTSFIPQSVEVLPRAMQVAVSGSVRQFIGNVLTSTTRKCWTLQFRYLGTRLWLEGMQETNCKKPFETSEKQKEA